MGPIPKTPIKNLLACYSEVISIRRRFHGGQPLFQTARFVATAAVKDKHMYWKLAESADHCFHTVQGATTEAESWSKKSGIPFEDGIKHGKWCDSEERKRANDEFWQKKKSKNRRA